MMPSTSLLSSHRIVIIGDGAVGLELATKFGDRFFRRKMRSLLMCITPIDQLLWKPLLHKAASGSREISTQQVEYLAQVHRHHFEFQQEELIAIKCPRKTVTLAAVCDEEGTEITPQQKIIYDTFVLAIGSQTNFFGVHGA